MIQIDTAKFLSGFADAFSGATQDETDGLTFLLGQVARDTNHWPSIEQLAYGLATFKWETGNTYKPVYERGLRSYFDKYEPGTERGKVLGNTVPGDGYLFRGRGYVQLTGRANYIHAGQQLQMDLVSNPDRALDPTIAYQIASSGMKDGWFTARKLEQYIPVNGRPDYFNARRIINALDNAQNIADIAVKLEGILRASLAPAGALSATRG